MVSCATRAQGKLFSITASGQVGPIQLVAREMGGAERKTMAAPANRSSLGGCSSALLVAQIYKLL